MCTVNPINNFLQMFQEQKRTTQNKNLLCVLCFPTCQRLTGALRMLVFILTLYNRVLDIKV